VRAVGHTLRNVAELISVNLAVPRPNPAKDVGLAGIDKRPAAGPVRVLGR
jgi:hypothetical protein